MVGCGDEKVEGRTVEGGEQGKRERRADKKGRNRREEGEESERKRAE